MRWIWEYSNKKRPQILKMLDQLSKDKEIIILKSLTDIQGFLEGFN
ncbi:hypothetical protein [Metabacillus fastidiosus]|nr:hypothetical protein [Metabacillus fastidiosus]